MPAKHGSRPRRFCTSTSTLARAASAAREQLTARSRLADAATGTVRVDLGLCFAELRGPWSSTLVGQNLADADPLTSDPIDVAGKCLHVRDRDLAGIDDVVVVPIEDHEYTSVEVEGPEGRIGVRASVPLNDDTALDLQGSPTGDHDVVGLHRGRSKLPGECLSHQQLGVVTGRCVAGPDHPTLDEFGEDLGVQAKQLRGGKARQVRRLCHASTVVLCAQATVIRSADLPTWSREPSRVEPSSGQVAFRPADDRGEPVTVIAGRSGPNIPAECVDDSRRRSLI